MIFCGTFLMKQRTLVMASLFASAMTCTALLCPAADSTKAPAKTSATSDMTMEQMTMAASEGAPKPGTLTADQTKFFEGKIRPPAG